MGNLWCTPTSGSASATSDQTTVQELPTITSTSGISLPLAEEIVINPAVNSRATVTSTTLKTDQTNLVQPTAIKDLTQIDVTRPSLFIEFIDNRLSDIKAAMATSTTSGSKILEHGKWGTKNEAVIHAINFASKIVDKISKEVDNFQKSGMPQEMGRAMRRAAADAVRVVAGSHWILLGFSMVASALERIEKVSSNLWECIHLLESMAHLAKILQRLKHSIPEEAKKLNDGVQVIVEGAIICCDYIAKGKASRYWHATLVEEQLEKTRTRIQQLSQSVDLMMGATTLEKVNTIQKQISRREEESPLKLVEIVAVGLGDQIKIVKELLEMEGSSPAVAVILYGFGGVGKSTLAASVIQKLNLKGFKFCRVIVDADNPDKISHILKLQQDIIFDLATQKIDLRNVEEGRQKLAEILQNESNFLFIDNVVDNDYVRQLLPRRLLRENAMDSDGVKQKLRILITSRENTVSQQFNIECKSHLVQTLSHETSVKFLGNTILGNQEMVRVDFDEKAAINNIAKACHGVPLLLDAYGRHLKEERNEAAYKEALASLLKGNFRGFTDTDLSKQLLYVYHKMDEDLKEAFADICIFFHGWQWDVVSSILGKRLLNNLVKRALVKNNEWDEVIVHDVLRLMGRNKAAGTRLQSIDELSKVLEEDQVLHNIRGIWLLHNKSVFNLESKYLDSMHKSLRVLALGDWIRLDGQCRKTFHNLRFLHVGNVNIFPFKSISKFENLTVFYNESMPGMGLVELPPALKHIKLKPPPNHNFSSAPLPICWKNIKSMEALEKFELVTSNLVEFPEEFVLPASLVEADLSRCTRLPKEFGRLTSLTKLKLEGCIELKSLPEEFGKLRSLKLLNMNGCENVTALPKDFGMLSELTHLCLKGCKSLKALPGNFGKLRSLETLDMNGCKSLALLPQDFGQLCSLQCLDLSYCSNLTQLPASFELLTSLRRLNLTCCQSLVVMLPVGFWRLSMLEFLNIRGLRNIPENIEKLHNLTDLRLEACQSLTSIPSGFGKLRSLRSLQIYHCCELSALPTDFGQLSSLNEMQLVRCSSLKELPESFPQLQSLEKLCLTSCSSLVNLPKGFEGLRCLRKLELRSCDNLQSLPDGFGKLKNLETLFITDCHNLKKLSDDFERLSSLRTLGLYNCKMLPGAILYKVVKLESVVYIGISGSSRLELQWKEMERNEEHYPFVLSSSTYSSEKKLKIEYERAAGLAFFHEQARLVGRGGQSMPSCKEIRPPATVALLIGHCKEVMQMKNLQKIMGRIASLYSHIVYIEMNSEHEQGTYDDILALLPVGSRALTHCKRRLIFQILLEDIYNSSDTALITAEATSDCKGRKCLVNFNNISAELQKK